MNTILTADRIENMNGLITFINKCLSKQNSIEETIIAFEKITRYVHKINKNIADWKSHISLNDLAEYMQISKHSDFDVFAIFFSKASEMIREQAEKSHLYKELVYNLILAHLDLTEERWNNPLFTYTQVHKAIQYTFDQYDANKSENEWAGFWSLIDTKKGEIVGINLSDTADRDYFWEFIDGHD